MPELDSLIDQTLREIQELESQARQRFRFTVVKQRKTWRHGGRGNFPNTVFSCFLLEETVSNLRTGHKEIQLMEPCRVSSMKSSEHLLVKLILIVYLKEWIQQFATEKWWLEVGQSYRGVWASRNVFCHHVFQRVRCHELLSRWWSQRHFLCFFSMKVVEEDIHPFWSAHIFFSIEWVETTIWLWIFLIPLAICYTSFCRKRCGPNPQSTIWRCEIGGRPRNFHSEVSGSVFFLKMSRFFTHRIWPGWPHLGQKLLKKIGKIKYFSSIYSQIIAPSHNLTV